MTPVSSARYEPFPMTDMQQAYWIGRQEALADAAMHIYLEYRVEQLDPVRFRQAWDTLLQRHDMLRVIALPDGMQQVLESVPAYDIACVNVSDMPTHRRESELESMRHELSHRRADIATWPQFEIRMVLDQGGGHVAFSLDSWCIDGRSLDILLTELDQLYHVPETELAPLELTFRDYVLWSRQQEQGDAYESELAYWRERVADLAGPPALPVRSELALELGHFERQAHQFNAQQTQQLRELAQSLGMTVNGLLLGTYAEVLGRWSSTPRFTLNIPRFNRPQVHEQINSVMGEFATFSLLSVDRQQGATLGDRLKRIQEDLWQALDHSRVSGVRLLREISRLNGRVETMAMPIVFTSAADGFTLERFGSLTREITQTPQVWLDCQYYFVSDGLYVNWDYVASRFHPGVIEQMFTAWCVLLQGLCVPQRCEALLQSQQAVDLPDEQKAVRAKLNDQRQAYDSRPVYRQFVENMDKRADDDQLVAVCGSERLTYGQLHAQSAQLGSYLQLLNDSSLKNDGKVQPLIGVLLPKGVQQLVAVYGVLASGAAYLPLDLAQPQARLDSILRDAGVNQVLVDAQTQSQVSPEFETLRIDEWQAGYCHSTVLADEQLAGWQTTGQDLVYVMYTSGSTGQPKGVQIEQAGVLNALDQSAKRFVFSYPVRALGLTALHHDMSVYDVLGVPLSGGLLVLPEQAKRTDPQCWSELVHEYALNCWVSVPAAVEMLLSWGQVSNWRYESLRTVLVGGDWVAGRLYERLMLAAPQARLYSVGGPTETTMWNISAPVGPLSDEWRSVPYGVPLPNCGYRILDERMQACPDWVTGEMYCSGISLARGYVNDVALTAERFVFDVQTGERLYLTQDLGYYHPDGQIEFVGRADGQLKVRGNRIESGEVQSVLEGWPQVRRALVYVYELRLAAALVLQPGEQPQSRERLHEQAAAQLPSAMVPGVWLQLDQLPLTGHGKVDMEELRDLTAKQLRTQHPQSRELREGERELGQLWEQLLGVQVNSAQDNFFMLGGDSLLAVRLVVLIRERLGVDVRIGQVLTHPVLALMAQCISQQDGGVLLGYWEQVYERSDPIPLSFAQRRLWMLSQLDPHGTQYLIPLRFTLHGPLQRSRFEASFVELIERHTILRSYIVQDKSGQACVELVDEAVQLAYEDLQGFNDPERQQRLDQRLRDQASTTLDLGCHVPYRAGLIRLSSQEHVFYLTVHHAVLDGVATEVLVQELMALYAGQSLAPVEHDYVRYSRWEQSEAFAQQIEPGLSYWSRRLSDLQPLALPYMDIHASDETSGLYAQQLSEGERQELQKLARDHGVTAFTVYALGLQLVLGRLRQGGDVAFGTYAANRVYAPFSHTVGTFVNPLVLRFKYDEGESLSQALERTQLQVMQDFEWQHVPFERVVEQLNPPREPGRHPLFEVGLVCNEQLYQAQYEVQGLRLQPQGLDGREGVTHRTALEVWISPQSEGLEVVATYAQARVGDRLAQAVIQGLCEVLRQMLCVEPARQLGQIGWQTAQVAKQADVSVWQGDRQEWPAGTLWSLWQQQVKRQGPAVAVYGDEDQADVSWQQLSDGAEALAVHLVQQGVCAGEVVAVLLEHSPQLVQAVLGVVRSGAVLLLLEPGDPSQRHVELVADAGVRWIISNEVDEAQAAGLEQQNWVALPEEEPQLQALLAEREVLSGRVESEVLYWVYTSGSTGQPKAVQGSVRGFINRLYWMGRQYGVQAGERALLKTSVSFVDIYGELLGNLLEGVALVVASDARRRDPAGLLWRLREGQVDRLTVTPSLLQALCEQLDQDGVAGQAVAPLSLRLVFSSGEALSWSLVRQARASLGSGLRLVNVYGSSEVSADVAAYEVGHEEQEDASVVSGLVPVGQLMSNVKARIVGQEGLVQWPGLVGRLQLGGVALSPGYAGKARRAESMFYENEGERWFDTGDEVIRNARGELIVLGRRDAQVKLRGIRIDLQGLDVQVAGVAGVRQSLSAVIDTGGGPVLGVLVVVQGGATQQAVRVALQQQLPAPMVPGIIEVVQQLPRLSTGKPDRGQAAALLQQALQCEQDEQQALTPLQQRIEQIWRTLLQREQPIGAHQNFFTLGGHSLMLARLASRLRIEFKADVSMGELMNATTIASQSAQVEKNISNTADILPLVERPTVFPLSENQLGLWTYQQSRPDAASYNMTFVLRMHGCLNLQQFSVALNLLVKRHEALRYRFVEQRNEAGLVEPALKIEPDVWLMPEYRRISGDLQEESEIEAARLSAQPFDLEQGPLLRVSLLQAEQDSYACVLSMHHIIADGWSVGVLLQDLAILYEGRAPDEMAFQLVDYEAWRRSWLGDVERQQRLASFWHDYLAQLPGRLEFSILPDLPDGVSVYESATLVQTLDKQWATVLPEICRQRSNEIYDVVLAAFSLALHELTKRQDLVIGTVLAARHLHPELEKMVGFLANTVPVRTAVDDTMPLQVFFDGVVERRRQALQHQDIPFGALQNLQRGSDPLIEVLCIHQNVPYAGFSLPGVQCEVESVQVGETKFPLNLQTLHDGEKLVVHFEYARAYFAESTIMRMLATMQRFLRIYCDTLLEHKTVGDLLLAPYALTRGGAIRLPESRPRNLPQALARTVEKYPDHGITIIDEQGTEVLTYARLDRLARDYAGRLNRAGVNEGDPVILVAGGIRHYLITLWGAILLGAIPVTVAAPIGMDAQACLDKLEATWETLAHPLVIAPACDPKVWRVLLRECPGFRIVDPRQLGEAPPVTLADPQPETTAFFQLTAGSTGRSKCIEERHEAVLAYMEMTSQARNYDADQRTLNWLPFDHIVPILTFHLRDIYLGRDQVHVDTGYILQQPLRWMQLMSDLKVTHGWAPNFAFHLAVQALDAVDSDSSVDLGHVRELLNAGEMVTQATQDAFRRSAGRFGLAPEGLVASFGMAECCTCITYATPQEHEVRSDSLSLAGNGMQVGASSFASLGKVIPGMDIRIIDDNCQLLREYQVGKFQLKGLSLMRGYHNAREINDSAYTHDGWFDTGDNGFIANGCLYLTGREKEVLIVNGINYFCFDLEEKVQSVTGIMPTYVAALSWRDVDQEAVAICYVPVEGTTSTRAIDDRIRDILVRETGLVPKKIVALARHGFQKTTSGKIQRVQMAQKLLQNALPRYQDSGQAVPLRQAYWQTWTPPKQPDEMQYADIVVWEADASFDMQQLPGCLRDLSRQFAATSGVHSPTPTRLLRVMLSEKPQGHYWGLFGLLNSYCAENPGWKVQMIQRSSAADAASEWPVQAGWFRQTTEGWACLTLGEAAAVQITATQPQNVLITGGGGALAWLLAQDYVERGATVWLLGRSDAPPWLDDGQPQAQMHWIRDDLSMVRQTSQRLEEALPEGTTFDVICHLAGTMETGLSSQLEDNALIRTMRAKVEGLEVLRKALKMSQKSAPAQWVLYGSVVAACGFPLSGAYAYANGALLDMAHSMRAEGEQVCWLGWSAWRGVGMSRNGLDAGQLASHGLHLLEPEQARLHHWRLAGTNDDFFIGIEGLAALPGVTVSPSLGDKSPILSISECRERIENALKAVLSLEKVQADDHFFDLGATSISLVQIQRHLRERGQITLDVAVLLQYPTVTRLTQYMAQGESDMQTVTLSARKSDVRRRRTARSSVKTPKRGQ
ncbi:amino acid adenylation domain-containing protein [Halomonas sp. FME1]|uniref:Amino acid adenylation domain-containing protein n=3 Tax=Halomonas TaxID=2745 RepID=A0ABR9F4E6_9GAMM|nr:non-ribosomal peptide synthetase [Halomonas casei]MBE0401368.1 amino acid adenylation domain-containing protein [Halomonas casei]